MVRIIIKYSFVLRIFLLDYRYEFFKLIRILLCVLLKIEVYEGKECLIFSREGLRKIGIFW